MRQETLDKFKAVQGLIDGGSTIDDALKTQKMSHGSYYLAKKETSKKRAYNKTKNKAKKGATFVDVPIKTHQQNVAVIVCTPDQVKSIIEGIR